MSDEEKKSQQLPDTAASRVPETGGSEPESMKHQTPNAQLQTSETMEVHHHGTFPRKEKLENIFI